MDPGRRVDGAERLLALCGGSLFSLAIAIGANSALSDPLEHEGSSMLSRLKVGQHLKLGRALSGGYNVNMLNDSYVKGIESANPNYTSPRIINVGRDFIVVDSGDGLRQTISINAIDVITHLPEGGESASESDTENEPPN